MRNRRSHNARRWVAATAASLAMAASALVSAPIAGAEQSGGGQTGPLTPTLQQLAANPAGQTTPGSGPTVGIPESGPGSILTRKSGRILVDVRLANTDPDSLDQLRAVDARIAFVADDIRTVTVAIDPADLDSLAALTPLVQSAQEVLEPMTNAACPSGPFVSEGLSQLRADLARTQFAVQGRDVTVGVLSDSYNVLNGATTDVSNGELPGAGNPCGDTTPVGVSQEGPGGRADEGRAMAQIIHDVAPKAKIIFASAFLGEPQFAQSIRDLANAGADIIVDDVTYFAEPMYQDGVIAKAVADVTAQGVTYFSSAANSNKIIGGKNVGSYEAPALRTTSCPAVVNTSYSPTAVTCHDFVPGAGSDATYGITISSSARYSLGWSEPQFGIATNLDLCVLNSGGALVGCVKTDNLTTQDAFEGFTLNGSGSFSIVIVRAQGSGTPRLKLVANSADLSAVEYDTSTGGDIVGPTTYGHNASRPGVTVGAVPYNDSNVLETFSSFGPATYCWNPVVGTTPASAIPCETATVDMAATDGVQNSFFGGGSPNRFYGTSAAAPHAAAVAALILDREQCMTPAQVTNALKSSGRPVGASPVDGAGAGLIDAQVALTAAGATNCDTSPPAVTLTGPSSPNGWFRTPSVVADVTATDRRTVTDLACTGATVSGLTGLGSTNASAKATVSGDGIFPITCTGKDFEDNSGAAGGSANTATIKIDTTPPVLTCQAASFGVGQSGNLTAGVSDTGSGPAVATVSAPASTSSAGSFTATVTGADVAGNTASTSCAYTVSLTPKVTGPSKAKLGAKKRYSATGFPASSAIKWTLTKKGKKVSTIKLRTNAAGGSKVKFRFAKKGKFVVKATSGGVSASTKVKVK